MEAAAMTEHDETVHFPPLSPGERVRCTFPDPTGVLAIGREYTVNANTRFGTRTVDAIILIEVPGTTFPETLFDRIQSK